MHRPAINFAILVRSGLHLTSPSIRSDESLQHGLHKRGWGFSSGLTGAVRLRLGTSSCIE